MSPMVREILTILTIKISQKASGEDSYDKFSTKFANIHYIETTHAIFLAIIIGGVATQASTYCIISIDFLMNIYYGMKVVKMHKNGKDSKFLLLTPVKIHNNIWYHLKAKEDVQELILTERIEFIVPLTYMAMMLMAYYGPNADILGNVKLNVWHFQAPIDDINTFVKTLSLLFSIDFLSFIINAILLWKTCKINALAVLQNLQKKYGYLMFVSETYLLFEVRSNSYKNI